MVSDGNKRIMITLSKEMIRTIEVYCRKTGLSRSSYCAGIIADKIIDDERKDKSRM